MFYGSIPNMKTTTKNKNQFWVIQNKNTRAFLNKDARYEYTKKINNALLLSTRNKARNTKTEYEIIQKVSVSGKNIEIIAPEWQ
jgi:hypothetical protein